MDTSAPLKDILDQYKDKPVDDVIKELNKVPLFMSELGDEENPALEALKSMAYEGDPDEIAQNFRNQGNDCFKVRQYKDAIVYYTKALDQHCGVDEIETACLGNRAQANMALKNYRRSINDSREVLNRDSKNTKAWYRMAKAFMLLERYEESISCSDFGLQVDPANKDFLQLRNEAQSQHSTAIERRKSHQAAQAAKETETAVLKAAISARNISRKYSERDSDNQSAMFDLGLRLEVPTDASSMLYLPVQLLYPEQLEADLYPEAQEEQTVGDILKDMMSGSAVPKWMNSRYNPDNLDVFSPTASGGLAKVGLKSTLRKMLATMSPDIVTINDMAQIYVVPRDYTSQWLSQWDKSQALKRLN